MYLDKVHGHTMYMSHTDITYVVYSIRSIYIYIYVTNLKDRHVLILCFHMHVHNCTLHCICASHSFHYITDVSYTHTHTCTHTCTHVWMCIHYTTFEYTTYIHLLVTAATKRINCIQLPYFHESQSICLLVPVLRIGMAEEKLRSKTLKGTLTMKPS